MKAIPSGAEVLREAIIVIAGAALAAAIVSQFPQFKEWVKKAWA